MPTYTVAGGPLTEEAAAALLAALGADTGSSQIDEFLSEAGSLLFMDAERFQALPLLTGNTGVASPEDEGEYVEYLLDIPALLMLPDPPSPEESIDALVAALNQTKLHPAQFYDEGTEAQTTVVTGHSNFELLAKDLAPVADVDLDTHVALELALAADVGFVDLVGPGGSLKAVFDADGAVLVHYEMLLLEPGPEITVIGQEEAEKACADNYARSEATSQGLAPQQAEPDVTARLVYYAPPFETKADTVYPYYLCGGTTTLDGGDQVDLRQTFVKANQNTPDVMSPPSGEEPARPEEASAPVVSPSAFGVHDAGTEWVGVSGGLAGSRRNAGRFYDTFDAAAGVDARFNWGDGNAWEQDFRDPTLGGTDTSWADNVDVAFYTGHASGNGFTFTSTMDDTFLHYDDAHWGDNDLEWLVIAACGPLQATSSGLSWAQRWGPAFQRLHLLLAYANVSRDNEEEGRIFARAILGVGESPKTVRAAWVKAATQVQPSSVTYAVMGVGTFDGMVNWNDYFWGRGTGGGPDIPNADVVYYWKLSGPS